MGTANNATHGGGDVVEKVYDIGIEDKPGFLRRSIYGMQHLVSLSGIWILPVLLGISLNLNRTDVGGIIQSCFLLAGLVTMLQSARVLRLPIATGPSSSYFVGLIAIGSVHGLGAAFGSAIVAMMIFIVLAIPLRRWGLLGRVIAFASSPLVFGVFFIILGSQLTKLGLPGWFGRSSDPAFGGPNFIVALITLVTVALCMLFGGNTVIKRAGIICGVIVGTAVAYFMGIWTFPDLSDVAIFGVPKFLPFGFDVVPEGVLLMTFACFQISAEASGIYDLVAGWDGQKVSPERANRGLFVEFIGSCIGTFFGGIGASTYPENASILRITKVGSRHVTFLAGAFGFIFGFVPIVSQFIAHLPQPVLLASATILWAVIGMSGVQLLARVKWDNINMLVATIPFAVGLGGQYLSPEVREIIPPIIRGLTTSPAMLSIFLLITLNLLLNKGLRPILERNQQARQGLATATAE